MSVDRDLTSVFIKCRCLIGWGATSRDSTSVERDLTRLKKGFEGRPEALAGDEVDEAEWVEGTGAVDLCSEGHEKLARLEVDVQPKLMEGCCIARAELWVWDESPVTMSASSPSERSSSLAS